MFGVPLPNCSVVFFHHVEKTAGTTLRAIFQRHAQLGLFDLISFVGRQNRLQLQLVLHRLHSLIHARQLHNLRLAVELHVAGDLVFPYTLYYTLPDLLLIRSLLRGAGFGAAQAHSETKSLKTSATLDEVVRVVSEAKHRAGV